MLDPNSEKLAVWFLLSTELGIKYRRLLSRRSPRVRSGSGDSMPPKAMKVTAQEAWMAGVAKLDEGE